MRYTRVDPATNVEEVWYFVEVALDPTSSSDASKAKHVMRNAAGKSFHFPSSDFTAQFRLVTAAVPTDSTDAYKETLANIRHNSTIRFAVLPFFLTGSAILANAYRTELWKGEPFIAWFGLGLAVIAAIFEIALSRNLICWWKAIQPMSSADPWLAVKAHRSWWALWPVRYALFVPYLAAIYYWLTLLCHDPLIVWGSIGLTTAISLIVWQWGSNAAKFERV